MRLHALARVKNEGDIIEEFVRHTLRLVDALIVVDNASFDGTLSVLEALRDEGLPLTILHDPALPKRQYETVTRVARQSVADADWDFLFLLDADEFLKVTDRDRLERALAELSPGQNGLLAWESYVPTALDVSEDPRILNRIQYRRAVEANPTIYKSVLSRRFADVGDFTVSQGNHAVYDSRGVALAAVLDKVRLAHFPVRSMVQLQSKVLVGWGAYLAMGHDSEGWGWHQRRLFHELESNGKWSLADFYEIALRYTDDGSTVSPPDLTFDPLPTAPTWRYGNSAIADSMQFAALYVRQLASALAVSEATLTTR